MYVFSRKCSFTTARNANKAWSQTAAYRGGKTPSLFSKTSGVSFDALRVGSYRHVNIWRCGQQLQLAAHDTHPHIFQYRQRGEHGSDI